MDSPSVNLTKRVKIEGKWSFCEVAYAGKGQKRIRPNVIKLNGTEETHAEGRYYLDWREDGKRYRIAAGKDATEAENQRHAKELELAAINAGVPVLAQVDDERPMLTSAIGAFLEETKLTKKPKTL